MLSEKLLVLSVCCLYQTVEILGKLCQEAQQDCISRIGCGMALNNYLIGCGDLIYGKSTGTECTERCKRALISLMSTEDGAGEIFVACECGDNDFCSQQKQRVDVCAQSVMDTMSKISDNTTILTCSLAQWICEADTACFTALQYYDEHCARVWDGNPCSERCNNSLAILYRQRRAQKLKTCECDGTEEVLYQGMPSCAQIKYNTDRLCFGISTPIPETTKHPNGGENLQAISSSCRNIFTLYNLVVLSFLIVVLSITR